MKRLLFLDDDQDRINRFNEMVDVILGAKERFVVTVNTATECIQRLKGKQFDAVFLDHDLDLVSWEHPGLEENGMQVVDFVCLHMETKDWPAKIIVHSHNKEAAEQMFVDLRGSGFSTDINLFKLEFPSFFARTDKQFMDLLKDILNE